MIKSILAISFLLFTFSVMGQHTVTISIKTLPDYHPSGSAIYLAGSFNGWNPEDPKYKFTHDDGKYSIALKLDDGDYEYKVTRGGWDKSECKKKGKPTDNRHLKVEKDDHQEISVEEWIDRFPAAPKTSTASKNVHIIDTMFFIPQLKRTRRVWIYLPEKYPQQRYPVLYMHDGQNVFDDATAFSGEWAVDEFLDSTHMKECIVVAIDNGGTHRMNEYNPYNTKQFGKGEGSAYIDFIVKTLKPYIDKKYKTLKDKEHTSIAGSSMGGLISMYAVLKYPTVFGGAGVFSPSFWIAPDIYKEITSKGKKVNSHIYFYVGKAEGYTMVPDMLKVFDALHKVSKSKMVTVIRDEGKHNEETWRKEFPLFYQWSFGK